MTCGCGDELKRNETYQVEKQLHCKSCMLDAIDCKEMVLVRKIEAMELWQGEQTKSA